MAGSVGLAVGVPAVAVGTAVNVLGKSLVGTAVFVDDGVNVTTGGNVGGVVSWVPSSGAKNNKVAPAQ